MKLALGGICGLLESAAAYAPGCLGKQLTSRMRGSYGPRLQNSSNPRPEAPKDDNGAIKELQNLRIKELKNLRI